MNNTIVIAIITILIMILTIVTPITLAREFQEQIEDYRFDSRPILMVEAGGPYETTLGNMIFFDGYFTIYNNSLNVTGYRWNFGDQNSYEYYYPQPISNISGNNRCSASHVYGYGNFQAVLTIYIEQNSSIPSRIDGKISNIQQLSIQNSDIAKVSVAYDLWDEQANPNNYFKKYVWNDELGWSETTTHKIGHIIRFRINYTATNSIDDVVIKDFLPATVRYTDADPTPTSMSQNVYFDNENMDYYPTTKLIWDIGDMYSGEQIYIEIYGIVEYLDKSYFGIIDNNYPIIYSTNNLATLTGRRHSAGCGNPYSVSYTANADFTITCENPDIDIKKYVKEKGTCEFDDYGIIADFGDDVVFKLVVTNTGNVPLENVWVCDVLPVGLVYNDSASPDEPDDVQDNVYCWNIGTLVPGQPVVITFEAFVEECGEYRNVANVFGRYNQQELSDGDDAKIKVECKPDFAIRKYVSSDNVIGEHVTVKIGDIVHFIIEVENLGNILIENIEVKDELPNELVYHSAHSTPDIIIGQNITWYTDLNPYETKVFYLNVTAVGPVDHCDEITVVNWVYGYYPCTLRHQDHASVTIVNPCEPDFEIRKYVRNVCCWDEHVTVEVGDVVHFKIEVENTGDIPLENVEVRDELPSELAFLSAFPVTDSVVGQVVTWYVDLDVGEVKVFYLNATAIGPVDPCDGVTVVNWVYGLLPTGLSRQDNASLTIVNSCEPGVEIKKYVKEKGAGVFDDFSVSVDVDDDVVFKLVVTNTGGVPLENVWVCDVLPVGLVYNDSASSGEPDDVQNNVYCWNIVSLVPGQPAVITFEAFAEGCGEFLNDASVFALFDQQELVDDDNASVVVVCEPEPGLTIEKAVKYNCNGTLNDIGITVPYGMWVTFRIEVINTGDVPLDLTIYDELPIGMLYLNHAYVNGDLTPPTSSSGNIYCWYIGIVNPGDIVVIKFRAEGENCETYINNATATGTYQQEICSVWDTAYVIVECEEEPDHLGLIVSGECIDGNATFTITNTGDQDDGDMNGPTEYRVYRNNILEDTQSFQLNIGESLIVSVPGECDIIRLEANQRLGHPGTSQPQATVEGCGCTEKDEEGEISKSKDQPSKTRFNLRSIRELFENFKDKGLKNVLSNIRLRLREILQDIICQINSR